jgi:hypothetical protein
LHSTAARPDSDDGVIEDRPAAQAAASRHEERNLYRPHASRDDAPALKLFEPVKARFGVSKADVEPCAVLPSVFQDTDDFIRRAEVETRSILDSVGLHAPEGTIALRSQKKKPGLASSPSDSIGTASWGRESAFTGTTRN